MNNFDKGEQYILDNLDNAIKSVKTKFDKVEVNATSNDVNVNVAEPDVAVSKAIAPPTYDEGAGINKSQVRVLTKPSPTGTFYVPNVDRDNNQNTNYNLGGNGFNGPTNNQSASAFVAVVVAVIALLFVIFVLIYQVLSGFNI